VIPARVKLDIRNAIARAREKVRSLRERASRPFGDDHLDRRTRETADAIEALVMATEQMLAALNRPQPLRRKPARRARR
jgi:hypothetical protein